MRNIKIINQHQQMKIILILIIVVICMFLMGGCNTKEAEISQLDKCKNSHMNLDYDNIIKHCGYFTNYDYLKDTLGKDVNQEDIDLLYDEILSRYIFSYLMVGDYDEYLKQFNNHYKNFHNLDASNAEMIHVPIGLLFTVPITIEEAEYMLLAYRNNIDNNDTSKEIYKTTKLTRNEWRKIYNLTSQYYILFYLGREDEADSVGEERDNYMRELYESSVN